MMGKYDRISCKQQRQKLYSFHPWSLHSLLRRRLRRPQAKLSSSSHKRGFCGGVPYDLAFSLAPVVTNQLSREREGLIPISLSGSREQWTPRATLLAEMPRRRGCPSFQRWLHLSVPVESVTKAKSAV